MRKAQWQQQAETNSPLNTDHFYPEKAQWACIVVDDLFGGTARWEAFWEDKLQIIGFAAAGSADLCRLQVEYITPPSAGRIWISWIPDSLLFLQPNLGTCASHLTFVKLHFATMFVQETWRLRNWNLPWCCSLTSICFLSVGGSKQGGRDNFVFFLRGVKLPNFSWKSEWGLIAPLLRKILQLQAQILLSEIAAGPCLFSACLQSNYNLNQEPPHSTHTTLPKTLQCR